LSAAKAKTSNSSRAAIDKMKEMFANQQPRMQNFPKNGSAAKRVLNA
jgi:hypothetical protein